jgi:AcrR family transcriptional regulator
MPKAFSEHEKEIIRAQMREKGKGLFEKQGLKKTSVDELTAAVGISKGAFYLFYESKEELFLEILEQLEQEIQTKILEFSIKSKANTRNNVSDLLKAFLLTRDTYPLLKNFGKSEFEYLLRKVPPEWALKHANKDEEFINHFIQKIKQEGVVVKSSPRVVSNLIKTLFFVGLYLEELGQEAYEETLDVMIDMVAGYIVGEQK